MPKPSFSVQIDISAEPAAIFALVGDLTRHGEWAANNLSIVAVDGNAPQVGSGYRSSADVGNLHFDADLTVTAYNPPRTFGFRGEDKTGKFAHLFTLQSKNDGCTVTRTISIDLTFGQYLMYLLLFFPVRRPAANKALQRLKSQLEK